MSKWLWAILMTTSAGLQLDIMDLRAQGYPLQGEAVAKFHFGLWPRHDLLIHLKTQGSDDIPLFSIPVMQKSNSGSPVWIVLDGGNLSWNSRFIPLEIDHAIKPLVTTTTMSHRDVSLIISASRFLQGPKERLVRFLGCDFLK